jgi:hypothetical protein
MDKHTPGPWIVFIGDDDFDILPAGRPGEIAGRITNSADASLIVAAPDMLKALIKVRSSLTELGVDGWSDAPHLMDVVGAAIAKAEGQS